MIQNRSRAGMTMLEVVIASAILIVIVAMAFGLLLAASNTSSNQGLANSAEERLQIALDRMSSEIRNSGGTYTLSDPLVAGEYYFDRDAPLNLTGVMAHHAGLSFGLNTGFKTTGPKTGAAIYDVTTVKFSWRKSFEETLNNLDDNSNGLIDEGELIREETTGGNTTTSILCHDVPRRAVTFRFPSLDNPPRAITISLRVALRDATLGKEKADKHAKLVIREATRTVGPRS